jgi:hypothetical protein
MFGNSGIYNIKLNMQNLSNPGGAVVLCGGEGCKWVDYSAPGNIMYGYLSGSRIEQGVSWAAAGMLEILDSIQQGTPYTGTLEAWGDNAGDKAAVDFGYALRDAYPNGVTPEEFEAALTMSQLNLFQAPSTVPSYAPEPHPNIYPPGYFLYKSQ